MTDPEIILHGLRDRDDDSRIALRRIAERCERAEARVKELETALLAGIERCRESTVSPLGRQVVEQAIMEMRIALGDRAEARGMIDSKKLVKAEARVKELESELSHSILDAPAHLVEAKADALARVEKAESRVRELEAERERMREALERIRDREWIENALDPQWPARRAGAALAGGKE